MNSLKQHFLLNPDVIFLNHGSFGATPRPVFETYQHWQRALENQPVHFIVHELFDELRLAREALGAYVKAPPDDLVFVPNATFGVNIIARSLDLKPGDEVLTSDHEYGACDNAWTFICGKRGAIYCHQPIPLPISSQEEILDSFWRGVSAQTRVIFLSHITSPTALTMPVDKICRRAREAGILTVIDGAHAPGQITLDLIALEADFYVGNCHKWMMAPKGSGFLYARRERQDMLDPLVVSWGWGRNSPYRTGSDFLDRLEWWGTIDAAAYLAVPAAIEFMAAHDWPQVQKECHTLVTEALEGINTLTGLEPIYPDCAGLYQQLGIAALPKHEDLLAFQARLLDEYKIEIPLIQWFDRQFVRISVQGYNGQDDIDALVYALGKFLP